MVGRPAVDTHLYLYGILKAQKQPVQLRFIAGCSTRRRASVLCTCGLYMHLHCIGLRNTQSSQTLESIACKCKHRLASTTQRSAFAQNFRKHIQREMNANRRNVEVMQSQRQKLDIQEEQVQAISIACILAAIVTAQEQSMIKTGCYVRLHGLNKDVYNRQDGMVMERRTATPSLHQQAQNGRAVQTTYAAKNKT